MSIIGLDTKELNRIGIDVDKDGYPKHDNRMHPMTRNPNGSLGNRWIYVLSQSIGSE